MLDYTVLARRVNALGSLASTKRAEIGLDTCLAGRDDAFNPAELLLAAVAACMIKGIVRIAPMLDFEFQGVDVTLHAVRQDAPPKIISIDYQLVIDTTESDQRLELLHKNVRKYGTISNTIAAAARVQGVIGRKT